MVDRLNAEGMRTESDSMTPITPSHLYNHLTCPHRVSMDGFADPQRRGARNAFIQLLWERGTRFEKEVIAALGMPFTDLSTLSGDDKEAATRAALARGDVLIYSGRLSADGLLGEPDLPVSLRQVAVPSRPTP